MAEDPRCCGTGTCIINDEGVCWCGQKWDGEKMCFMPELRRSQTPWPRATPPRSHLALGRTERMICLRPYPGRCALFPHTLFFTGPRL
jgi:hypothetical protein